MSAAPINPYEISMDELARLAANQPLPPPEPKDGQPRDEQGRFVAVADDPVVDPVVDTVVDDTVVDPVDDPNTPIDGYTATIDVGDGSGVQVFEGATKDELLQKLIAAQENATRKIREQEAALQARTAQPAPPVTPTVNLDDEMALAQEFLSTPSAAFDKLYFQKFGETPAQTKAKMAELEAAKQTVVVNNAAAQFIAATPDYNNSESNNKKIERWIALNQVPITVENLTKAYTELNADGLLAPKAAAPTTAAPRSSGLSVRRSVAPPPAPKVDKIKEAYEMPIEKLRELVMSGATL